VETIAHFIGSSGDAADYCLMVRRIVLLLRRTFAIEQKPPEDVRELVREFSRWLNLVPR
jgi:hypothetical protein